ncbi:MAG: c-type cytochrome [Acidobacteria bacterium]|nr:c-type cytochrome [Acidobacteriota bacterium]
MARFVSLTAFAAITSILLIGLSFTGCAQDHAIVDATQAPAPQEASTDDAPSTPYDADALPDDAYGQLVRYGRDLAVRTFAHIGPEVSDPSMRYAGNNMACTSCHQGLGTKAFAMSWVGVSATFPQYRAREDAISTLDDRINGCLERSMAGKALPAGSREMKAFLAYMHFLSAGVPVGSRPDGLGLPKFTPPERRADPAAGQVVYQERCALCHGPEGAGLPAGPPGTASGYVFPPLWGPDSFNDGAGMARLLMASAFIKTNMPLGAQQGASVLTDNEAYDVAAFVLSHPRPSKSHLDRDFPARWNKPVDSAFPPYVDEAPADQHKYGPFQPLQEKMKALRDAR